MDGHPDGYGHLHRNVIFRGDAVPEWGGSAVEMENRPERLWEWLEAACTGDCQVVAIPHNSNLSGGLAFDESAGRRSRRRCCGCAPGPSR